MRIAILETGAPPDALKERFGDYPQMMRRMLAPQAPEASFFTAPIFAGAPPPRPADFDGLLITGSPAGVYEGHPWIEPAKDLIRAAAASARPVVGICFGHQLMAEAFGGRVERSEKGWGVGVHDYAVHARPPFMADAPGRISCLVSHQDQVVAPPPGALTLAGSDFCAYGALAYREGPAVSFQMHPEFEADFAAALLDARRGRIPEPTREAARASLARRTDRALIGRWIAAFFAAAMR
jgi:GMP synthase-like glutamine amidotransferase